MGVRFLALSAGVLFVAVTVPSVQLSTVIDAATTMARQTLRPGVVPLQFVPDGQQRLLIGAGLIVLSLVIFVVWGVWTFGGGSDSNAAESEGDATADAEDTDRAPTGGSESPQPEDAERPPTSSADTGGEGETTDFEQTSGNTFSWSEVDDDSAASPSNDLDSADSPAQPDVATAGDDDPASVDFGEHTLDEARAALADGDYETAAEDAYTTACEVLQTRYGVESAESPEQFYDRCVSNPAIDDSVTHHLEQLTAVHDRAVYGYGAATEDEAEQALSHATAIVTGGTANSPTT